MKGACERLLACGTAQCMAALTWPWWRSPFLQRRWTAMFCRCRSCRSCWTLCGHGHRPSTTSWRARPASFLMSTQLRCSSWRPASAPAATSTPTRQGTGRAGASRPGWRIVAGVAHRGRGGASRPGWRIAAGCNAAPHLPTPQSRGGLLQGVDGVCQDVHVDQHQRARDARARRLWRGQVVPAGGDRALLDPREPALCRTRRQDEGARGVLNQRCR